MLFLVQFLTITILWSTYECSHITPADKTLKLVHILFRHGFRTPTPLETYETDPYREFPWEGGHGALTNTGKRQMYILGSHLHKRYLRLLQTGKFNISRILARSSEYDRCVMSGAVFLASFFPPTKEKLWNTNLPWSVVPIHILFTQHDYLIQQEAPCPAFDKERFKYLTSDEVMWRERKNSGLYTEFQRRTGNNITNSIGMYQLYAALTVHSTFGLKLPPWTWEYYPNKLHDFASYVFKINTSTTLMKRLKAGYLIKEIVNTMQENELTKDIFIYAGHDSTITNLLNSLGMLGDLVPFYGSALVLEGHKTSINKTEIRIFYYENYGTVNPIEWYIPGCPPPCLIDDFIMVYDEVIPKHSRDIECGVKEVETSIEPHKCNICFEQTSVC